MLPREGTLDSLLGLLYESTTDDHAWELFLREVATATGGESAAIMLGKPPTDLHLVLHNWGQDPEGIRLYSEHYGKLDVWAAKGLQIPMTEWLGPSEALCSFDELTRTEFFNDFLIRYGVVHALFGAGQYLDGAFTNLSIFRNHKRGPFGSDDVELVRFLTPHIKRALRLHLEFNQLKGYSLTLQAALDNSPTAILLLDCDARVIVMNRMARTIIGQNDGLRIRHSRLQTEKVSDCATLSKLLFQAGSNSNGTKGGCANGMLVSRKQRPPLQVLVAPAGRLPIAKEHPIAAIMFINDPEQKTRPPREVLNSLFGLTAAESRVALLLTDGHSPRRIAEIVGVKSSTLKSQLSSIYRKTSTCRQSELVRLMMQFAVRAA